MVYNVHKNEYNCRIIGSWKSDNIRALPNPIAQIPNVLPKSINRKQNVGLITCGLSDYRKSLPHAQHC